MIAADKLAQARAVDLLWAAKALGAHLKRVTTTELAGACPKCGGHDRFAINRKRQAWHCRGCAKGGGDAISLVSHLRGLDFREAVAFLAGGDVAPASARARPAAEPNKDDNRGALELWRTSRDPRLTIVQTYLKSRTLSLDDELAGRVLRWNDRIGAMVALFRNIETNQPQAVSRTFLDRDGRKLGRKFLGPVAGAAIMLDENVLGGLHVSEGTETAMAARAFGLKPAWALGSAGAIAGFAVIPGVECLTILGERDEASARAVQACAERWCAAGREVLINLPIGGKDLNDVRRVSA